MPEKQANKPNKSSYLLFVPDSGQKLSIINQDGANSAPLYYHQRMVDQQITTQITERMSLAMNRRITTQISEQMSQEVVQPIMTQFSRQILQQMSPEILVPKSSPLTLQKS